MRTHGRPNPNAEPKEEPLTDEPDESCESVRLSKD